MKVQKMEDDQEIEDLREAILPFIEDGNRLYYDDSFLPIQKN
jgi:hypothetical protein